LKEERFTKILGEIDEEFIAEVHSEEKTAKIVPIKKWLALAACICLLAVSGVAVVAQMIEFKFLGNSENIYKTNYGREYTVYSYNIEEAEPVYLPESVFGERFHELEERLSRVTDFSGGCSKCLKTAPNSCDFHKTYGHYSTVFYDSPAEAASLIGYEKLIVPDVKGEHAATFLNVSGNKDKFSISDINMHSSYLHEGIGINITADMLVENPYIIKHYGSGFGYHVPVKSEESYVTLKNGEQCLMVKTVPVDSEDILITSYLRNEAFDYTFSYDGYIMKDGVYYIINVKGNSGDEEKAEEIFLEVANFFC